MPIAILDKNRAILQIVPDGYTVDGDTITTPGGSSWTVAGATQSAPITQAEVNKWAASKDAHNASVDKRNEVREAKRTTSIAAKADTLTAAEDADIAASLPAEVAAPPRYLSDKGDVVATKPAAVRVEPK